MIKKILLALCILVSFLQIKAQNIKGVDTLPRTPDYKSPTFLFKDKTDNIWIGFGGINYNFNSFGLFRLNKQTNKWDIINKKQSTITNYFETDSSILFTSFEGLQTYKGSKLLLNDSIVNQSCITKYKSKIIIGTFNKGIYEVINNKFFKIPIAVNNKNYDSIYCIEANGDNLWIGTSKGLLLYNGTSFKEYSLPIIKFRNKIVTKYQNEIKSIKVDKEGKVWVVSRNVVDTLQCLYILQNEVFIKAIDYYNSQCIAKYLIPNIGNTLSLDKDGNIVLGTAWGCIVLKKDSINGYNFSTFITYYGNIKNAGDATVFCDKYGDIYLNGSTIIKPTLFNNERIYDNDYINFSKININDIHSTTANTGFNTYFEDKLNPTRNLPRFSVPTIACAPLISVSSIWMGGENASNGDLHLAAETFRQTGRDYKPGPIDLVTFKNDTNDARFYNKIWKISKKNIDDFKLNRNKNGYSIPSEILDWPAHGKGNFAYNLAPFVDIDSNNIYEPLKGDYPKIKGDEFQWWVFNDLGLHFESGSLPLGVEIHGSCYAFKDIRLTNLDSNYIINRTLFFDYKIINRSKNDYKNFYFSAWGDYNTGDYLDDFVGCDTINNASFAYNNDNFDEFKDGFGKNPPITFCKLLNHKMTNFMYYENNMSPQRGNPNQPSHHYNYMQSNWQNGQKVTFGGDGDSGTSETNYIFTGKICNTKGWTETTGKNPSGNRRSLTTTSIPVFKKDSIFEFEFAYTVLHNPEIDWLKEGCDIPSKTMQKIQNWYDNNSFPSKPFYGLKSNYIEIVEKQFTIFPNPSNGILNIKTKINEAEIQNLTIYDNIGKVVYNSITLSKLKPININNLSSGIYILQIVYNNKIYSEPFVKE